MLNHVQIQSAMLISDWLIWGIFICCVAAFFWMRRYSHLREPWRQILQRRLGMVALVILLFYVAVGLLDSIHLRIIQIDPQSKQTIETVESVLDILISPLGKQDEMTYSAPFATHLYNQTIITLPNGKEVRGYPRLQYAGIQINTTQEKTFDILQRIFVGFLTGLMSGLIIVILLVKMLAVKNNQKFIVYLGLVVRGRTQIAWREAMISFSIIWISIFIIAHLAMHYHIFGTDKIGKDILYQTIGSIRTGLLIGTLTSIFMLPFALFFGTVAGYFRGIADDGIQYLYTTLSSIPGVLLISASILVLQVYINAHPDLFPTLMQRADARLIALCFILGMTSWASLCRLLRAETLKLHSQEYVQAAQSLGVGSFKILSRHVLPNVLHIVIITVVLDFSGLVLAEAVLSYVGVGVDPTTISWGNMINSSRLELAREPIVWWPLLAALIFMFLLVLSANIFADAVRDGFDPRLRNSNE